jgi:NAD dependent epimerase/dehydratase family enzyme
MFGEMAEIMLSSQRVIPEVAASAGFRFRYGDIRTALKAAISENEPRA